ncbi:hypothetical protein FisN_5Hh292 [Fistulifera solaris]|uniref:Uncharacterized protein n=1 Tax=Fistulifera solaris TaxID=1519565 RepID=A0A1Z5JSA9_FISSO|nr:hypothetical protein FisN_5Hh292 [Fistulifera solaris]|eukprot:GAX16915.1 hypothetical protein FisN_5Hh292 [Fistulifera solaris]
MAQVEDLPVGVGRVPEWWMECTPHYILDLDEEQAQRQLEEQMATYFNQFAEINDMGALFDEEGNLKLGSDGIPVAFNSNWQGRSEKGEESPASPRASGRNFRIDPKVLEGFGVKESDPDYQSYLRGAKLPPGFIEKLRTMYSSEGIPNNSHQTDYGRYGRQAERPAFKPNWTKTKLRSTAAGQNIRQGQYDDSPNKHYRRRMQMEMNESLSVPAAVVNAPIPSPQTPVEPEPVVAESAPTPEVSEQVYEARAEETETAIEIQDDGEDDLTEEPEDEQAGDNENAESEGDEDDDGEDEEDADADADLADLQAILAAKQAELAKLQEQL